MRPTFFFQISSVLTALLLAACATSSDQSEYLAMSCKDLQQLAGNYEAQSSYQTDLLKDETREAERHNSGSPWADRGARVGKVDNKGWEEESAIRTAYRQKGCQK